MRISVGTPRHGLVLEEGQIEALRTDIKGIADPVLQECIRVITNPSKELAVSITGTDGPRRMSFSLDEHIAAVIMSRPEHPAEMAAVTPDSVPSIIARAVGLGPAPYLKEPNLSIPTTAFEALTHNPPTLPRRLTQHPIGKLVKTSSCRIWSAQMSILQPNGEALGYRVDGIGATGQGWWLVTPKRKTVTITRTRSATLWGLLCDIMTADAKP